MNKIKELRANPIANKESFRKDETRATNVNGRTEMLPSDPMQVAKILRERRSKSPASRAKAKMAAEAKKRGF